MVDAGLVGDRYPEFVYGGAPCNVYWEITIAQASFYVGTIEAPHFRRYRLARKVAERMPSAAMSAAAKRVDDVRRPDGLRSVLCYVPESTSPAAVTGIVRR